MYNSKDNTTARMGGQWSFKFKFFIDQLGASAIEYALIGSLISVFIVATLGLAGVSLDDLYTRIGAAFS